MYEVKMGGFTYATCNTLDEAVNALCDLRARCCFTYSDDEFELISHEK